MDRNELKKDYEVGKVFHAIHKFQRDMQSRFLVIDIQKGVYADTYIFLCIQNTATPGMVGQVVKMWDYDVVKQYSENDITFISDQPEADWLYGLQEIAVTIDDKQWYNEIGKVFKKC